MIKSIAIYPDIVDDAYIKKVDDYVKLAGKYHYDEVFTTIHLPEYSLDMQLEALRIIAKKAKEYHMDIVADIGGYFIDQLLNNHHPDLPVIDFIRLDYGYSIEQVSKLYHLLHLKGFVINASTYDHSSFDRLIKQFRNIDDKMEIRCCHNFYVRKESGLDELFAYKQDMFIRQYGLPIYYCIPSLNDPRGPLYLGLPTLEKHRSMELDDIICDLYLNYDMSCFLLSDMWFSEEQLLLIDETLVTLTSPLKNIEEIAVCFEEGISEKEKNIVLGIHQFRYDSPYDLLRSKSSRNMAEFASVISVNNTVFRKAGTITIDNERYKRYSGELEIVCKDMDSDDRVNVVARIDKKDIVKLRRFREGISYKFIQKAIDKSHENNTIELE